MTPISKVVNEGVDSHTLMTSWNRRHVEPSRVVDRVAMGWQPLRMSVRWYYRITQIDRTRSSERSGSLRCRRKIEHGHHWRCHHRRLDHLRQPARWCS